MDWVTFDADTLRATVQGSAGQRRHQPAGRCEHGGGVPVSLRVRDVMHSQLVVLGGGPGGYAAAFLAADRGLEVTLVESEPRLGGTCLLRGCVPSKALLHVARVIAEAEELTAGWGISFARPQRRCRDPATAQEQAGRNPVRRPGPTGQAAKRARDSRARRSRERDDASACTSARTRTSPTLW